MTVNSQDKKRAGALAGNLAMRLPQLQWRRRNVAIMPDVGAAGKPLMVVISVMSFLACLALGGLVIINRSVNDWTRDMASQVTVQIKPEAKADSAKKVATALRILRATPGVTNAVALSREDSLKLLEPWLGAGALLQELPVPLLINVTISKRRPPDLATLSAELTRAVPGARLDDHNRWQKQILRATGAFRIFGYGVLLLVSAATIAIVVFATRAAMSSNRDVVEVLHFVGARDNFIAVQVQRHFLSVALKAGVIGGFAGFLTFAALRGLLASPRDADGGVSAGQLLLGAAQFGIADYSLFLFVPLATALISVVTARLAVLRILGHVL